MVIKYERKIKGETKTYNCNVNIETIPKSFRAYFLSYLENLIEQNQQYKAAALVSAYSYIWEFILNSKILNFHDLISKLPLLKEHLNKIKTKKGTFLTKENKRLVLSKINIFCKYCHGIDKNFAPNQRLLYNLKENYINHNHIIYIPVENNIDKAIFLEDVTLNCLEDFKSYLKYRVNRGDTSQTISGEVSSIKNLWEFMKTHNISSINEFDFEITINFVNHVKTLKNKKDRTKYLSLRMQQFIYNSTRDFIRYLSTINENYLSILSNFEEFKFKRGENKKLQSIPSSKYDLIKKSIKNMEDIYLKVFSLLIITYGLRRSEVLHLKYDCLKQNELNNKMYDLYFNNKKGKNKARTIYKIDPSLVLPIKTLIEKTKDLRKESKLDFIFLTKRISTQKVGTIGIIDAPRLTKKLNDFLIKKDIDFKVTPHMFRRTIPTIYEKKGISLETTQQVLGHRFISTTDKYYNKTNEYAYINTMKEAVDKMHYIKDISLISEEYNENNGFKMQIEEGYCTNKEVHTKEGLCKYLEGRGNCYGCPNMITTPEYIPFFESQIINWEKQFDELQYLGTNVSRHLEWKIGVVNEIISRLKRLNNDY